MQSVQRESFLSASYVSIILEEIVPVPLKGSSDTVLSERDMQSLLRGYENLVLAL